MSNDGSDDGMDVDQEEEEEQEQEEGEENEEEQDAEGDDEEGLEEDGNIEQENETKEIPKNNTTDTPENDINEIIVTSEEIESLTKQLIEAKVELSVLKKRKKLILEEIHRQCLEGELDPKKRLKPYYDKRKKLKAANDNLPQTEKV